MLKSSSIEGYKNAEMAVGLGAFVLGLAGNYTVLAVKASQQILTTAHASSYGIITEAIQAAPEACAISTLATAAGAALCIKGARRS